MQESRYYLGKQQDVVIRDRQLHLLMDYELPTWVPHRVVARALSYSTEAIELAEAFTGPYCWAPEFENVHACWRFEEPTFLMAGVQWAGSEQLFQAQKIADVDTEEFRTSAADFAQLTPMEAYHRGQAIQLRPDWDGVKDDAMMIALRAKFRASGALRRLLLSTHPFPLVSVKHDAYWGIGLNGRGVNRLGQLLVTLREQLRRA